MSKSRLRRRWPVAVVATAVALGALAWTSLAPAGAASSPDRVVVKAKGSGENMRFVTSDDSIQKGGKLVIRDKTSEPHTLSLVKKRFVPRTRKQVNHCFDPGHICREIAKWHKFTGKGEPKIPLVDAGKPGWNRQGSLTREGDSVVFDPQHNPPTRPVTAQRGTTLHFICAIHPWMHGKLDVK